MKMPNSVLYVVVILATLVPLCGCSSKTMEEKPVPFKMTVHDVFYIKTLDRVIVTGVIETGSVRTGDKLAVKTANGTVAVVVQKLEHPKRPNVSEAHTGQDIGLMLQGIGKDQVASGDVVVAREEEH
jgi:translation elongation factor EF-1alpha